MPTMIQIMTFDVVDKAPERAYLWLGMPKESLVPRKAETISKAMRTIDDDIKHMLVR